MKKVYFLAIAVLLIGVIFYTGCQQTAITAAKVYMQQSNYDSAIEQCKAAIEQVPTDAEAYFVLGKAYGHKNMYQEMNEAFTQSMNCGLNIGSIYSIMVCLHTGRTDLTRRLNDLNWLSY
jgi:tetratricopeptide (TPR) repeat protein